MIRGRFNPLRQGQTFCFVKISRFWQYFSWYTFQNFMWYMYSYVFWPQKAIFGAILMRRGIFNPLRHEKDCYFVTKYVFDSKSAYIYIYMLEWYMIYVFQCILTSGTHFLHCFNDQNSIKTEIWTKMLFLHKI